MKNILNLWLLVIFGIIPSLTQAQINVDAPPYNAVGDGVTDDYNAIQSAILDLRSVGGTLTFTSGKTYVISEGLTFNTFPDDKNYLVTTTGDGKATIKVQDGSPLLWYHWGIRLSESNNVTLKNLIVDGNRDTRNPVGEPSGVSAILIDGASNGTRLENLVLKNAPSDNLYIVVHANQTMMTDFEMHNCKLDNAWRNNMSVISGANFKIISCEFTNANGTAPEAGIDFEPNETSLLYTNMTVEGCLFKGNHNFGIELTHIIPGTGASTIRYNIFDNNGILIGSKDNNIHNNIFINQDHQHKFDGGNETRDGVIYFHTGHTATGNDIHHNHFFDNNMPAGSHLIKFMNNSGGNNSVHDNDGYGNTVDGFVMNSTDPATPAQNIIGNLFKTKREIGEWTMNTAQIGTDTIYDLADFTHNGIITGATTTVGAENEALDFAPDNNYVTIPSSNSIKNKMTFTVMGWVKWAGANADPKQGLFSCGSDWNVGVSNNGQLEFGASFTAGTVQTGANTLPENQWKLVTATYDGRNAKIYVDGDEVASEQANGYLGTALDNIYIGSYNTTTNSFNGAIDDVRLFNYPLTLAEIQAIHSSVNLNEGEITIVCPANMDVTLPQGATTMNVEWAEPMVSTSCLESNIVTLTQIAGESSGSSFAEGSFTVEYSATDQCDNNETCSFSINVGPFVSGELTIVCPDNIDVTLPQGANSMVVDWESPMATTTCPISDIATVTINGLTPGPGSDFTAGTYNIGYEATDECGNELICGFVVTVNPFVSGELTITCPEDINVTLPLGATTTVVSWDDPIVATTCPASENVNVSLTGMPSGSDFEVGTYDMQYAASDECGNTVECSFNVVVDSIVSGVISITCPGGVLVTLPQGDTSMVVTWDDPVASTTCSVSNVITISQVGPVSGSELTDGLYYVEYTAMDECNHSADCGFSVIVQPADLESCPSISGFTKIGELNGHGYYLSNTGTDWLAAQTLAQQNGGYLASISSEEENNLIQNGITNTVFIGLNDVETEGGLVWDDGSAVTYTNYAQNCPWCNVNAEAFDFVSMMAWDGSWAFDNQFVVRPFVMEVSCSDANTEITLESCQDLTVTLPVGSTEMVVTWSEPVASTTCDSSEIIIVQTNGPTSGTSLLAGVYSIEYVVTDQCGNSATCSFSLSVLFPQAGCGEIGGYTSLGDLNGHRYYMSNTEMTWNAANTAAAMTGGTLVVISDQAENDFLQGLIGDEMVFIGFTDAINEGTPVWTDGTPVTLDLSYNNSSENDFAVMNFWAGTWQMVNQWVAKPFILEMDCGAASSISISCPDDILAVIPALENTTIVNWNDAIATTSCVDPAISITQISGPSSGSMFEAGDHVVTYEATDNCNNAVSCSFNISVSNPNDQCGDIAGYTHLGDYNGHGYYMSDAIANFSQAQSLAFGIGGYLTTISSLAENDSIQSWLGNEMVLIGFNDGSDEGSFNWINGEAVTLDLSYGNTPMNDYAVMNFWAGTWEMVNQWVAKRYILEMDCTIPQATPQITQAISGVKFISTYPSPADDFVITRIISDQDNDVVLAVVNLQGEIIKRRSLSLTKGVSDVTFEIQDLEPGVYFLKVAGNQISHVIRFVKMD